MNVSLDSELERLIHDKVNSGLYPSASEVVREALELLDERDKLRVSRLERIRKEVELGIDQADRGEVAPLDIRSTLDQIRARMI